jgi:hypothetical protein
MMGMDCNKFNNIHVTIHQRIACLIDEHEVRESNVVGGGGLGICAEASSLDWLASGLATHGISGTEGLLVGGGRADESTCLLASGGLEGALWCSGHAGRNISWASS